MTLLSQESLGSVKSRAIRGSIWTIVGYSGQQGLRLGGNLVVSRLLFPEAFGIMAIVNVFMQGLAMFSDLGIGPSIIQNKRGDDPDFLNTAWTVQVIRGFLLFAMACALSWPVMNFYGQPMLGKLLPVAGLSALIAGFNATAIFTLNRHLMIARMTVIEISAQAVALVVMISWALMYRSVWALVGGGLAGVAAKMLMTHVVLPGQRNKIHWDASAARSLISFGKWIFLSTLTTFLVTQSDRLVFGKLITLEQLGVYSIAILFAMMPTQVMMKVGSSVVFPAYSRVLEQTGKLQSTFTKTRSGLLILGAGVISIVIACGPFGIRVLYDDRYHEAGDMLQILAIASWFQILECTNNSAILAIGKPKWIAAGNLSKLVGLLCFMPLGYMWYGFYGAIGGIVLSETLKYATSVCGVRLNHFDTLRTDVLMTLLLAISAGAGVWLGRWIYQSGGGNLGALVGVMTVLGVVWLVGAKRSPVVRSAMA